MALWKREEAQAWSQTCLDSAPLLQDFDIDVKSDPGHMESCLWVSTSLTLLSLSRWRIPVRRA